MKDNISNDYGHCYYCVCVNENCAFIYNLYVNKEHRRKGHAKQFIQQAINKIRETGYEKDIEIIAASPRIDAVVAGITKMSRSQCLELFSSKKIYVNGLGMENKSSQLKEGDILVIRGFGKFIYNGAGNETRKGRVYIKLQKY